MPRTSHRKEDTHERIVRVAARALRARGYAGVGVAEVMKEAGLTHGGFYAHFESRSALLAEAADRAGVEGVAALGQVADAAPPGQGVMALVDAYLSRQHLQAPEAGCPIAAAGSELPRQDAATRAAATRRIKDLVGLIERHLPHWGREGNHEQALAVLSCLVGSMVIARAADDAAFSKSVRVASREFLKSALEGAAARKR